MYLTEVGEGEPLVEDEVVQGGLLPLLAASVAYAADAAGGHGRWLVVEAVQHSRRGDLPAQSVARRLEDGVGVVLVDAPHGQAPAKQLHGEGLWAGVVG